MLPAAIDNRASHAAAPRENPLDRLERCWASFADDRALVRRGGRIAEISPTHYKVRDLSQGARLGPELAHLLTAE